MTVCSNTLGLRDWCDQDSDSAPMSMADLMAQARGDAPGQSGRAFPFPSLDALNESCDRIGQTRDLTASIEGGFLAAKSTLKLFLDPFTQPLSWMLDGALWLSTTTPWWIMMPLIFLFWVTESKLYGIAIILYAIVPVIRLTDLGIRLVDRDVNEAADAFGMTKRQKLWGGATAACVAEHHGGDQPDDHDVAGDGGDRVAGFGAGSGRAGSARHPQSGNGRGHRRRCGGRPAGGVPGPLVQGRAVAHRQESFIAMRAKI